VLINGNGYGFSTISIIFGVDNRLGGGRE